MRLFRRRRRSRPFTEDEAYRRSYGERTSDVTNVRPVETAKRVETVELSPPRPRPRHEVLARGERIRQAFLDRLTARRGGGS